MRLLVSRRDALTLAMLTALSGCTGRTPSGGGAGPVTIDWYASTITNRPQEPRQALIDAFQRAFPAVTVQLISAPTNTDEARNVLHDMISDESGTSPDVYLGDVIWPAEFAAEHLAQPLNKLFDPPFWSRFPEELVRAASYDGETYAVPFYVDQGVLLYRKDLLEKENLPNPPRTWEELTAAAHTLLDKKLVDNGFVWQGAEYEGLTCVWTEFTAESRQPGEGVPPDAGDARPRVDTPRSRKALTFMRSLLAGGVSPAAVTSFREAQSMQAFGPLTGRGAAFLRAWNSAYFDVAELSGSGIRDELGIAPLPVFAGERGPGASTIGGWSLYVNPHTRHPQQVADFIDWMTARPAQLTIAQYSVIPTNRSVRDDRAVRDNPVLAVSNRVRPVRRPSGTRHYRQASQVIYSTVHKALMDETVDPEDALRRAQRRIDDLLA
ncbi:MAG TPA: extracellular solute-binding protein [Streptosporangiaceae bacterium]|nr:extracellular solute-binding protein [Streptosporangiaceae bacterium]